MITQELKIKIEYRSHNEVALVSDKSEYVFNPNRLTELDEFLAFSTPDIDVLSQLKPNNGSNRIVEQ